MAYIIYIYMINKIHNNPKADPNSNYSIIHKIIENAKNERIPTRMIKFNAKKMQKKKNVDNIWNNQIHQS